MYPCSTIGAVDAVAKPHPEMLSSVGVDRVDVGVVALAPWYGTCVRFPLLGHFVRLCSLSSGAAESTTFVRCCNFSHNAVMLIASG